MKQADFVIRECEGCHDEMADGERRRRCKHCGKLICGWCLNHVHAYVREEPSRTEPRYKLCRFCGQPMKPKGVKKKPDEYDHAQGCPYSRRRVR